jgi:hypothetical protein
MRIARLYMLTALVGMVAVACWLAVFTALSNVGPLDYRSNGWSALFALGASAVLVGPLLLLRLVKRHRRGSAAYGQSDRAAVQTTAAVAALGLFAVAGVGLWRGVIWPWTKTAGQVDPACQALDLAGLAEYWPATERDRIGDEVDHNDIGAYSYCWWSARHASSGSGSSGETSYQLLTAWVRLHEGRGYQSAIASAVGDVDLNRVDGTTALSGIGDEAIVTESGSKVVVTARRANVVISVGFDLDPSGAPAQAQQVAQNLVTRMLAPVHIG